MTRALPPLARLALLALPALPVLAGPPLCAQTGVSLREIPALAKGRAERQRPALEQKLAPHWRDLARNPVEDHEIVEARIAAVVALGESTVPLLLEKLAPAQDTPDDRFTAKNCAVILSRLEPKNFTEALIDIATGKNYTAQDHAIWLLGMTESPQAGKVLTKLLDSTPLHRPRRRGLIRALASLHYAPAAPQVARLLPCDQLADHEVVVEYLMTAPDAGVVPHLLATIPTLRKPRFIMDYVRILRKVAVGDAKVASALLPLLSGEKLDQMQLAELCKALGTVAPRQHDPTITSLRGLIDTGRTGDLELEAAIALGQLGDKIGPQRLLRALKTKVRGRNKRNYLQHNNLGDYYLAFGDYQLAVRSYDTAIKHTDSVSYKSMLFVKIARAEARRERWTHVRKALKESKANYQQLLTYGQDYPELGEAYKQESVRKFLDSMPSKPKVDPKTAGNGQDDGKGNGK